MRCSLGIDAAQARTISSLAARLLAASLLIRQAPPEVADLYCATRLGGRGDRVFGELPATGYPLRDIVRAVTPRWTSRPSRQGAFGHRQPRARRPAAEVVAQRVNRSVADRVDAAADGQRMGDEGVQALHPVRHPAGRHLDPEIVELVAHLQVLLVRGPVAGGQLGVGRQLGGQSPASARPIPSG